MPKFIDVCPMKPFKAGELKDLQNAPPDEFGIRRVPIASLKLLRWRRPAAEPAPTIAAAIVS